MMRLSPRLICFIGASSALLHSALAAQEDSPTRPQGYKDLVAKIDSSVGIEAKLSCHDYNDYSEIKLRGDKSKIQKDVAVQVWQNGHRILTLENAIEGICNITDIETNEVVVGHQKLQELIVTGTKCIKASDNIRWKFDKFNSTMTFVINQKVKRFHDFQKYLIGACEFKIGKFKMVKTKDIKMADGLYNAIQYSRQDKSIEEGGHYILDTKPSKTKRVLGALCFKKQQVFKRAEMMLCRNEEGKPVAVWDFGKKNKTCQWIELRDCFSFLKYQDDDGKFMDHPLSGKVMKQYSEQNFGTMIWDTEYVLKGQAYDVTLGKGNKETSKSNERTGFLHFVRENDERCAREHKLFAEYIKKSGLFDPEEEYTMGEDFGYIDQPQFELPGSEKRARRPTMLGSSQTTGFANPLVRAPSFTGITRGPQSEEKSEVNHDDLNDQVQKQLNNLREAPAPKRKHDERLTLGDEIRQKLKKRGEFKEPESKAPTKCFEAPWASMKLRETTPKSKSQPEDKHNQELIQQLMEDKIRPEDVVIPDRRLRRRLYASELSL